MKSYGFRIGKFRKDSKENLKKASMICMVEYEETKIVVQEYIPSIIARSILRDTKDVK